jgi:hypothetical protein
VAERGFQDRYVDEGLTLVADTKAQSPPVVSRKHVEDFMRVEDAWVLVVMFLGVSVELAGQIGLLRDFSKSHVVHLFLLLWGCT